jgi:membrane protease YdiL (CAAX protease family)
MPPHVLFLRAFLSLVVLGTFVGMLTAYFWFLRRVIAGRALLPPLPRPPKLVPWGVGTVVYVVLLWFSVNILVAAAYSQLSRGPLPKAAPASHGAPGNVTRNADKADRSVKAPESKASKSGRGVVSRIVGRDNSPLTFHEQILLVSIINLILLVVVPVSVMLLSSANRVDLGLTSDHLARNVAIGGVAFLLITPVVMTINGLAQWFYQLFYQSKPHPLLEMLRDEATPGVIVLAYVSAAILAPAAEELIFRGIIQGWLRRVFLESSLPDDPSDATHRPPEESLEPGITWLPTAPGTLSRHLANSSTRRYLPVVLTSAFFALVHFPQMPAPLALFPLALVLGTVYERTGSLVPSVVLHALFNGFNTTMLLFALLMGLPGKEAVPPVQKTVVGLEKSMGKPSSPLALEGWAVRFWWGSFTPRSWGAEGPRG